MAWFDILTEVAGVVGTAIEGAGDFVEGLFGGGGYADINLGDPNIPMLTNVSGAAEYGLGGIGDMWDVDVLQNFPDPVSGLDINLMDAVFNYGGIDSTGAPYSGLADIGGYMGLTGDVGGFMTSAEGPVSWMGKEVSPSGFAGTPSGSSTGVGQQPSSGSSGSSGGSRQGSTGGGTGKPSSVVPDTIQKLANLATATGGMMPTPPLRPGKTVSATQMMPKVPPRNVTAAQYIKHYTMVAGTKPASFKLT
jgi:hypothetical protein